MTEKQIIKFFKNEYNIGFEESNTFIKQAFIYKKLNPNNYISIKLINDYIKIEYEKPSDDNFKLIYEESFENLTKCLIEIILIFFTEFKEKWCNHEV